jgi:hypothetical protein
MPRLSKAANDHCQRALLVVLFGAALGACAPLTPSSSGWGPSPDTAAPATPVREDISGRFIELIGVKEQHAPPYLGTPDTNFYCLRSFIDRQTGATANQLYVADSYDGKRRDWDAAYDATGKPLRFVAISRLEITCKYGCSYAEEFAADIPQRDLLGNPQGFSVTFADRDGDRKTITVSATQVAAQQQALAAQPKTRPAPGIPDKPSGAAAHQP